MLSRGLADSSESNFQSEIWEEVGRKAITDSEHQGLKKKVLPPEPRNWIPWGCVWQRAQGLFSCSFFWISLWTPCSHPFVLSFCFYLFPLALADFLFFLASFPHLSTFLASFTCSHFLSILLPCHSLNKIWSQSSNKLENECMPCFFTSHVP